MLYKESVEEAKGEDEEEEIAARSDEVCKTILGVAYIAYIYLILLLLLLLL
jgi:hypothetical protein